MTTESASRAFAAATATLVHNRDVADTASRLLDILVTHTSAVAAGVLVSTGKDRLDLLSASSHRAVELELFQAQEHEGPCWDVIREEALVQASSPDEIERRWPTAGSVLVTPDIAAITAAPMRWQGKLLGGLNVFFGPGDGEERPVEQHRSVTQAFADLLAAVVVQDHSLAEEAVEERVRNAVASRATVEQAKGVLAYTTDVDMGTAYDRLLADARDRDRTITEHARWILEQARQGRPVR